MSGFNVPYMVGDGFGRDHQYWPTISPAEFASFTGIPPRLAAVDLATIIAMTWRIKTWKLSGHVTCTEPFVSNEGGNPIRPITLDFDLPTTGTVDIPLLKEGGAAVREIDIIADGALLPYVGIPERDKFRGLSNLGFQVDMTSGPSTQLVSITASGPFVSAFLSTTGLTNPFNAFMESPTAAVFFFAGIVGGSYKGAEFIVFDADLFYPFIDFRGRVYGVQYFLDPAGAGSLHVDAVAGSFDLAIKVNGSLRPFPAPYPDPTSTGTATFSITPKKFWPYSNTLGEAIFDEDTGAETGANPFA